MGHSAEAVLSLTFAGWPVGRAARVAHVVDGVNDAGLALSLTFGGRRASRSPGDRRQAP